MVGAALSRAVQLVIMCARSTLVKCAYSELPCLLRPPAALRIGPSFSACSAFTKALAQCFVSSLLGFQSICTQPIV